MRLPRKILLILLLVAGLPAMSYAEEWWDSNNDGIPDVVELPPFEVNGNDPETFDWDGYNEWWDSLGINDDAPDPFEDFDTYGDFWGWAGAMGTGYTGDGWKDDVKNWWSSGGNSKGNCARYALGDPKTGGQNHSPYPGTDPGGVITPNQFSTSLQGLGATPHSINDPVPNGYRLIYAVLSEANSGNNYNDFHFYRQEWDGSWSHKPGSSDVIFGVSDPASDASGRTVAYGNENLAYNTPVGYFLVPEGGLDLD